MLEITFQYCHTLVTGHWWWFPPPGLDPHGTELPRGSQCGREEGGCELVVMHLFRYRTDTGPLVGNMFGEYWGHCKLRNSFGISKKSRGYVHFSHYRRLHFSLLHFVPSFPYLFSGSQNRHFCMVFIWSQKSIFLSLSSSVCRQNGFCVIT